MGLPEPHKEFFGRSVFMNEERPRTKAVTRDFDSGRLARRSRGSWSARPGEGTNLVLHISWAPAMS